MMEQLIDSVQNLVKEEYERAAAEYGWQHTSQHEAFAVILEEYQETCADIEDAGNRIEEFWKNVCTDDVAQNKPIAMQIHNAALLAACEAIQVAAMAYKATKGYKKLEVDYE